MKTVIDTRKAIQAAVQHLQMGNSLKAEQLCREILRVYPDNSDALHFLGVLAYQTKNYDNAKAFIQKSLEVNPRNAYAHFNLGNVLKEKGLLDDALVSYERALQLTPAFPDAWHNRGIVLQAKGLLDEAAKCYERALQLNPNLADAYYNLGTIYQDKEQVESAIIYYKKALHLNPNLIDAYYNLGTMFQAQAFFGEAISCYEQALQLNPKLADVYNNAGISLQSIGNHEKAFQYFQKAILFAPDLADAHFNLALIHLLLGNYREGWEGYEWRLRLKGKPQVQFSRPRWDGSDIEGKTILIHSEQGFGDTLQFIRYASLVAKQGAKVIVECQKELASLLHSVQGIRRIILHSEPLPDFDVHCPLLSLPLVFKTTLESIPARIPYATADADLVKKWREKIQKDNKLKIGLVWSGNPQNKRGHYRSCPLDMFAPLGSLKNVALYSLQKGDAALQAKNPPEGIGLIDYTEEIMDFSDTAALVETLDLVVTVDTSVAHLAGALGKPVWTLIHFASDWRWMLNREDSPWYPTMRLFRQPLPGAWESVIQNVVRELKKTYGTEQNKEVD